MSYLTMHRGDDRIITLTASQELTGSDVTFTARRRKRDTTAVIEKVLDAGIALNEDDAAVAHITLDAEDTEDLEPCVLHWDIEVVDAFGKVHTVAMGRLAVVADITRSIGS